MTVQAPERPPRVQPDAEALEPVEQPRAPSLRRVIAGALAAAGAAWMAAGVFTGGVPRAVALGGVALGGGLTALSLRTRRPAIVQYLVLPVALVAGALLVLPATGEGNTNIVSLVADALRGGGLAQPPVAFDPGWRFVLFVLAALTAASSGSMAIALDRPRLAVAVPAPLLLGAALLQPEGAEMLTTAVSLAFVLAALAVSYGGELAADGATTGGGFETRRLARGGALVAGLVVGLVALNQANVLFPETARERVVPAQRPPSGGGLGDDRVLFSVEAETPGPWRMGVLDGYDGAGWLLPPYDPARFEHVDGAVPGAVDPVATTTATFRIADVPGHVLPVPAEPLAIEIDDPVQIDPRTGIPRLPETRARAGLTYTVTAAATPGGRALAEAPAPPPAMTPFLEAPDAPNEVVALLADAPANAWDRLVFARAALFENVVAAGQGTPVDVPPGRVVAMLDGAEATPFEITAAEALLARWAGVPSRIGFGFYGGEVVDGALEVHPRHGATWLEVFFEGHGWVPVVGVPPRARTSLTPAEQQDNPNVEASEELALIVHVPIRLESRLLLFTTVRWWLARGLPVAAGALLVWWLLPGVAKRARTVRRRRWARAPTQRVAVAYAELRDGAIDLGIGDRGATPLGFVSQLEADAEHAELAWLVSRALWGDLRRDLRDEDATAAEEMARSVLRRLRRAQPGSVRLGAFGARASLRDPYTTDVPNLWPRLRRPRLRRPRLRARPALAGAALLVLLAACARTVVVGEGAPGALPPRLVPEQLAGLTVAREEVAEQAFSDAGDASLVHEGRVYTISNDLGSVEGYVQIASFVGGVSALDDEVLDGVLDSIGTGGFRLERLGEERVWVQALPSQRLFLSFAPDGRAFTMLVARREWAEAPQAFIDIVRHQRGDPVGARAPEPPSYDPRRGTQ